MFAVPAVIGNRHYHMFYQEFSESVKGSCANGTSANSPFLYSRTRSNNGRKLLWYVSLKILKIALVTFVALMGKRYGHSKWSNDLVVKYMEQ